MFILNHTEQYSGRITQSFALTFVASRSFSGLGDLAVDDISFIDCDMPKPQASCSSEEFR